MKNALSKRRLIIYQIITKIYKILKDTIIDLKYNLSKNILLKISFKLKKRHLRSFWFLFILFAILAYSICNKDWIFLF